MIDAILLDMDEVLVDFTGGALAVHGWTRERLESCRTLGEWDITKAMGVSNDELWEPICALKEDFWIGLHPLDWFYPLMEMMTEFAKSIQANLYVVTSPGYSIYAYSGKMYWMARAYRTMSDSMLITNHKHLLARRGSLLIDDREETVKRFRREGGDAILFPSRGNCLWPLAKNPLHHIQDSFKERGYALPLQECKRCV